jgi:hypothetical protein
MGLTNVVRRCTITERIVAVASLLTICGSTSLLEIWPTFEACDCTTLTLGATLDWGVVPRLARFGVFRNFAHGGSTVLDDGICRSTPVSWEIV